jgi:two-component system sensor histidine kinase HydH
MTGRKRTARAVLALAAVAVLLSVSFALVFIRREIDRRRAEIEFRAFRVMVGVLESYRSRGGFDPADWPEVRGFGAYSGVGICEFAHGSAPAALADAERLPPYGFTRLSRGALTIVRPLGAAPPMMDGPGRPGLGPRRMMGPMGRRGPEDIVFAEIDVSPLVRRGRFVIFGAVLTLAVFLGVVASLVLSLRRIDAYRERERSTARLVQLGAAARTLAHEIKNPLGVIRVQCATLKRTVGEGGRRGIEVIEEETERLVGLTDRIRDFLQSGEGQPAVVDPADLLDRCRARYGDRVSVIPAPAGLPTIRVDPERVLQVLDNLISNAMDADSRPPELSLERTKGGVSFSVRDRGPGVPEEARARLFEPFFTTKARGSGIGLALSQRLVEQAGGELSYRPSPEGGSLFVAEYPAAVSGGIVNDSDKGGVDGNR